MSGDGAASAGRGSSARVLNRVTHAVSRYLLHVRVLWRASPVWSALALSLTVLEAIVRTFLMVEIGQFVGSLPASVQAGAGSDAAGLTWRWFLVVAVLLLAGRTLSCG
jgi:hypothetical protein